MKISRGKIYKVLLSRNQTKKKKPKKHLHKRKHKKRRTYHKRKRPHLRNKSLKVNKRHKRHKGGARLAKTANSDKEYQDKLAKKYAALWENALKEYVEIIESDKFQQVVQASEGADAREKESMYKDAVKKLEAVKQETKERSLVRGIFDAVAGISSSTKAKMSISDEINKFIENEKAIWNFQNELGKSDNSRVVKIGQIIDSNKEGTSKYYQTMQDGYAKLKLGVGIDALVDLELLKLEEDIVAKLDQLEKEENVEQKKSLVTEIDSLMTELSKIMSIFGRDPGRTTISSFQAMTMSIPGSDNSYYSTIRNELNSVLDGLKTRYEEILGLGKVTTTTKPLINATEVSYTVYKGKVSARAPAQAVQEAPVTTSGDSQEITPTASILNTSIETENTAKKQIRPEFNDERVYTGPQVVPSAKELDKSGIKIPPTTPTESVTESPVKPAKIDSSSDNEEQGVEMQSMGSTKNCSVYTPEESDDKKVKEMMKERCNKNENCSFDDESNKCNNKGGTSNEESSSSAAASAIPQKENIPPITGAEGVKEERCDEKKWSEVLEKAKISNNAVIALCDAGIERSEITASDGSKITTDIPKNKGYTKIEINGDGNCGWYSMLEYFHLYGDRLIGLDSSSELGKIIQEVKGSDTAAGRGPSGVKGGLGFSKEIVNKLRNYSHGLSRQTDNQLTSDDLTAIGKVLKMNTICLYESGSAVPKWYYYNDSLQEPGIIVPTSADNNYPIPMMLYHTGKSGTNLINQVAGGHYSLLTLGEDNSGKVFNVFKSNEDFITHKTIHDTATSSASASATATATAESTETTETTQTSTEQSTSTDSDCQSAGICNENKEFVDYYKTLSIKRPSEWSKEYAKAVDLAYKKAKKAEDEYQSDLNSRDGQRRYRISSSKFDCETEAYRVLSNADNWAKYDSTYEKCGGKEKADWKPEEVPKLQTTSSPAANAIPQGENIPPPTGEQSSQNTQEEQQQQETDTETVSPSSSSPQAQEQQQESDAETVSPAVQPEEEQQPEAQQEPQAQQQPEAQQQPQAVAIPKPQTGTISTTHVDVKPSGELVVTIKAVLPKGSLMNVTGPGGSDTTAVIRGLVNHINQNSSGSTSQPAPQGEATPAETSQDDSTPPPQQEIDDQQPPEVPPPSPPTNEAEQQGPVFGPLNKADQLEKNAQDTQQEFATALQESDKAQNQADTAQSNLEKEIAKAKEAQPENEDSGEVEGADQGQVQSVSEDDDKSSENEGLRQRANAKKQDSENTSQDINESESDTTAAQLDKVDPNDKNPALKKAKQEQKKTQQAAEKAAKKLEDKRRKAVAASKAKIDKQDGGKKKQTKKRKYKRKRRQTKRK